MVTNIQHDPSHTFQRHDSREHPDSHLEHGHKDNLDRLRFN